MVEVTKLSAAQAECDSVHPDFDPDLELELEYKLMLDDWFKINHQHAESVVIFHTLTRKYVLSAAESFGLDIEVG
jgi:hypothetical protein